MYMDVYAHTPNGTRYILFGSLLGCTSAGSNLDPSCGGLCAQHGGGGWGAEVGGGREALTDMIYMNLFTETE